jgi:hypothetical protein
MIGREQQFNDPANLDRDDPVFQQQDEVARLEALRDAETARLEDLEKAEKKVARQQEKQAEK